MNRIKSKLTGGLIEPVVNFVYPPVCYGCDARLEANLYICRQCMISINKIIPFSDNHFRLRKLIGARSGSFDDVIALFKFETEGIIQKIIHSMKYGQTPYIGYIFGKLLGKLYRWYYGMNEEWMIIPIPLHATQKRERGYNQSDYIARGMKSITGAGVNIRLVRRIKNTMSQTELSLNERVDNVAQAFEQRFPISGDLPYLCVVDDVITTGSTMSECLKIIRKNYTGSLYIGAVCSALP